MHASEFNIASTLRFCYKVGNAIIALPLLDLSSLQLVLLVSYANRLFWPCFDDSSRSPGVKFDDKFFERMLSHACIIIFSHEVGKRLKTENIILPCFKKC